MSATQRRGYADRGDEDRLAARSERAASPGRLRTALEPEVRRRYSCAHSPRLSEAERSRIISISGFTDEEKASIFDALDVFAMASVAESFGIAYLEAWMCQQSR